VSAEATRVFARVGSGGNSNEYRYIGFVDGVERESLGRRVW